MQIIESEHVIACDIDETLLSWCDKGVNTHKVSFLDPYTNETKLVTVHKANLFLLLTKMARGATVLLWSRSGYAWAKAAADSLNLKYDKLIILSKPIAYIDDQSAEKWMGERICLQPNDPWGQI